MLVRRLQEKLEFERFKPVIKQVTLKQMRKEK